MILRRRTVDIQMLDYNFAIRNTENTEELGVMEFLDDAAAISFGDGVMQELMLIAATPYVGWTMEITEGERAVGSMPFKAMPRRR
jgi:hypothetical protein